MPILVVVMAIAAVVGATGAAAGVHGGTKIVSAHDKEDSAKKRHEDNLVMPKDCRYLAETAMNDLGKLELGALESFGPFVDIVTKLQNVPTFDDLNQAKLDIPEFSQEDLREVAVGAKAALGGIAGAPAAPLEASLLLARRPLSSEHSEPPQPELKSQALTEWR